MSNNASTEKPTVINNVSTNEENVKVINVVYGQQTFSPVSYHSFTVGPFSSIIRVREGEDQRAAMNKAYQALKTFARDSYREQLAEFIDNVRQSAQATHAK